MSTKRRTFFIAGTDTGVGKTHVACTLLQAFARTGQSTLGLKPVASGCTATADGLRNDDALALIAAATVKLPYAQVNPCAFAAPVSPHIAAARENRRVRVAQLAGLVRGAVMQARADITLVEGAGGWRVPLNNEETLADLARELQAPVILVVGLRLGCINHALLTAEAIRRDGLQLAGWVANAIDPQMEARDEVVATLRSALGAPLLGLVENNAAADVAAAALDVSLLAG
ncbi:MAG: dethiobiotin synthase [Gammaproteobacteria bacterium]